MKILIDVKLKSKKSMIEKIDDNHFAIWTTKEARDNMANIDIIFQLSKYFKIAKSKISIILGKTTKQKIIKIDLTKN